MNKILKNILTGVGSILVIAPQASATQLNRDHYLPKSDEQAIYSDWLAVGNDMKNAASKIDGDATK